MMILRVPGVPPSPNVLRRKYRSVFAYMNLRKDWERALYWGTGGSRHVREQQTRAKVDRMHVQIHLAHKKFYDPDNLPGSVKVVLDALKNIGFIKDDSAEHIELSVTQAISTDVYTRIKIASQREREEQSDAVNPTEADHGG